MSEYQFFEFQTLDRPLTAGQQSAMRRISHAVKLTPVSASFTYTAGSFKAEPAVVLAENFDAMIHLTGWGDKRLMFRFPSALLDLVQLKAYVDPLGQHLKWSVRDDFAILDISFRRDPGAGWVEAERWLPSLASLRADILRGDYRVLYLAWLKSLTEEDAEEATVEPSVPNGLAQLSPQLEAFLELFELDPYLLEVASDASGRIPSFSAQPGALPPFGMSEASLRRGVESLPRYEADAFLLRVAQGEPLAEIALLRRLAELTVVAPDGALSGRTTAELLTGASEVRLEREGQQKRDAQAKRVAELEDLASREEQAWEMVDRLTSRRTARAQDEAVDLLLRLREAAAYVNRMPAFEERLAGLCTRVKGRRGISGRLRSAGLCH